MNEKGNILIIEDRIQEKIGSFYDQLIINGYNIKIAETLEEANEKLYSEVSNLMKQSLK